MNAHVIHQTITMQLVLDLCKPTNSSIIKVTMSNHQVGTFPLDRSY